MKIHTADVGAPPPAPSATAAPVLPPGLGEREQSLAESKPGTLENRGLDVVEVAEAEEGERRRCHSPWVPPTKTPLHNKNYTCNNTVETINRAVQHI